VDVTTNTLAWRQEWTDQCYSGILATGGGLLFVGRNDGRLTALDSSTGDQLWEFQTGAGMHAPVSTFEHEGRQYLIAFAGGNALIGSPRGDSVWLFGLDGTLPPAASGQPVSRPPTPGQGVVNADEPAREGGANLAAGRLLYEQACVTCHGVDGRADHGAGAPLVGVTDLAATIRTITDGRDDTMPSFRADYTAEEIRDLAAYVVQGLGGDAAER